MSYRVHSVKKVEEYGAEGFNHKTEEFKNLLNALGCCVSGDYYSDRFLCDKSQFEKAIKILARYKEQGKDLKTDDLFPHEEYSAIGHDEVDDIQECLDSIGDDTDFTIQQMEGLLETADPDESCIYFVCY